MELLANCELAADGSLGPGVKYNVTTLLPDATSGIAHVPFVAPAVRDLSGRCRGYREDLATKPWSSVERIFALNRRYGVVEVRDTGNTWEALRYIVDVLGVDWVEACGPVLIEGEPNHEIERPVVGTRGARRAVESASLEGASWLMLGSSVSATMARSVVRFSQERGLQVAARPGVLRVEQLAALGVDTVYGAASCFAAFNADEPDVASQALVWSTLDPEMEAARVGEYFVKHDIPLVSEYVATRRRVLLDEAIQARGLEELVPILPAMRYLLEMRKAGGQRIGRQKMAQVGAMQKLGRKGRAQALEGLDRLGAAICQLQRGGVRIIPGSAAPSVGMVPGIGFWEEMEGLSLAGCDAIALLREATARSQGDTRIALGADPREDPRAAFSVVAPVDLCTVSDL